MMLFFKLSRPLALLALVGAWGCDKPLFHEITLLQPPNDRDQGCAPEPPGGLSAAIEAQRIVLTWTTVDPRSETLVVERSSRDDSAPQWIERGRLAADATELEDTLLSLDTLYAYRLRALRLEGSQECVSVPGAEIEALTYPFPVASLDTVPLSSSALQIVWVDTNDHETAYRVSRQPDGGAVTVLPELGADAVSFDDTSLTPGERYTYEVIVINGSGASTPVSINASASLAPELEWIGAPVLAPTCELTLSGTSTFDALAGAVYAPPASGDLDNSIGLVATDTGLVTTLSPLVAGTPVASWTVEDSLGRTATIDRPLVVTLTDTFRVLPTPERPSQEGRQVDVGACANCTGTAASISVGPGHVCAVATDGTVSCWGSNATNQLGPSENWVVNPVPACGPGASGCSTGLVGVAKLIGVPGGGSGFCAVHTDGTASCWGAGGYGQLGDGYYADRTRPVTVCASGQGSACPPLQEVQDVAMGPYSACAVVGTARNLMCWGSNSSGLLGIGTLAIDYSPIPLPVCRSGSGAGCVPLDGVDHVAVGEYVACVIAAGDLLCWGSNYNGQLADPVPEAVGIPTGLCGDSTCAGPAAAAGPELVLGANFGCALAAGGEVVCFGDNDEGQLGVGDDAEHLGLVSVCASGAGPACPRLSGVTQVSAGEDHACARLSSGEVRCWGYDYNGQIGDGAEGVALVATPVCLTGSVAAGTCVPLSGVVEVSAGFAHTCARTTSNEVYCWGSNSYGQGGLGGPTASADNPLPVCATGATWNGTACAPGRLTGVAQIVAGSYHTCAVLSSGEARCWGDDYQPAGVLGTGSSDDYDTPQPVCATGSVVGADCVPLTGVAALSTRDAHTCARRTSGEIWCWGESAAGRLGNPFTGDVFNPQPACATGAWDGDDCGVAGSVLVATAVSVGQSHTCVLVGTTLQCFGSGSSGELGDGLETDSSAPVTVCASGSGGACPALATPASFALGYDQSCALVGGEILCWGGSIDLPFGRGAASVNPVPVCASGFGLSCVPVVGALDVAITDYSACAIAADGTAVCWGDESYGSLGNGATDDNLWPGHVCLNGDWDEVAGSCGSPADSLDDAVAIFSGDDNFCARQSTGDVYCWGANYYGQFGTGSTGNEENAVLSGFAGVSEIHLAYEHSCARVEGASAGVFDTVSCSGDNDYGQLGFGADSPTSMDTPVEVCETGTSGPGCEFVGIASVAVSYQTSCAVRQSDGAVLCWGQGSNGLLTRSFGDYEATPRKPCADAFAADCSVVALEQLAAGGGYTCGIDDQGEVFCFGSDDFYQLGGGEMAGPPYPTTAKVCTSGDWDGATCSGGEALANIVAVAAGGNLGDVGHTCAIRADGHLFCWGANGWGQLGNNGVWTEGNAVEVLCGEGCVGEPGLEDVRAVALGFQHTCAIVGDGLLYCWGDNTTDQLGLGVDGPERYEPAEVAFPSSLRVVAITAGYGHTCAVDENGGAWCWGDNTYGQLGNGTTGFGELAPVRVCVSGTGVGCTQLDSVAAISAGYGSTCALLLNGEVRCWGEAYANQLGDGSLGVYNSGGFYFEPRDRPVTVCAPTASPTCVESPSCEPLTGVVALDGGGNTFCALLESGRAYCWGSSYYGQRGNGAAFDYLYDYDTPQGPCVPTPVCPLGFAGCDDTNASLDHRLRVCAVAAVTDL